MKFEFTPIKKELYEYHFITNREINPISDDCSFSSNEGFIQEFLNEDGENILFRDFFIRNSRYGFNSLLYQLVIYNLINHNAILVGPRHSHSLIEDNKPFHFLRKWLYIISNSHIETPSASDRGYKKMTEGEYLLKAEKFSDLVEAMKISDGECVDVEFYSIENIERFGEIEKLLNGKEQPGLHKILDENDIFVTISLGEDFGYDHYILVKSKKDISPLIKETEDSANEFAKRFMKDYHNKKSIAEVHSFLCELIKEVFPKCYSMMK